MTERPIERPKSTTVAIAGGGPAGLVLGLLLARSGVDTVVLEKHADFLRDFRGDTVHPSTIQVLDDIGLAEEFHRLPHRKTRTVSAETDGGAFTFIDFGRLRVRYPYIAFVPQWDLLEMLARHAEASPHFRLLRNAEVTGLCTDGDTVTGIRYRDRDDDGEHTLAATLTVAADGRHSDVRRAAGLRSRGFGAPMDVLWFRLPRRPDDHDGTFGRVSTGEFAILIDRGDYWQMAYVVPKGTADDVTRDVAGLRERLSSVLPWLGDRVGELRSPDDLQLLTVKIDRLERWHRPGLLAIGDAAHAMSPVGGVGINLAVQDAVAAANLLAGPLADGTLTERHLAAVQRRRTLPTRATQGVQRVIQRQFVARVLAGKGPVEPPRRLLRLLKVPGIRSVPARMIGVGVRPERVRLAADPSWPTAPAPQQTPG